MRNTTWVVLIYSLNNPLNFIDPNGKEVLNCLDKTSPKNIPILKAVTRMRNIDDPNVIHIYGHGNFKGFYYTD